MYIVRHAVSAYISSEGKRGRDYNVSLDGVDVTDHCCGASEEGGWADVLVCLSEPPPEPKFIDLPNDLGSVYLWFQLRQAKESDSPRYTRLVGGRPEMERRFGKVVITPKNAMPRTAEEMGVVAE